MLSSGSPPALRMLRTARTGGAEKWAPPTRRRDDTFIGPRETGLRPRCPRGAGSTAGEGHVAAKPCPKAPARGWCPLAGGNREAPRARRGAGRAREALRLGARPVRRVPRRSGARRRMARGIGASGHRAAPGAFVRRLPTALLRRRSRARRERAALPRVPARADEAPLVGPAAAHRAAGERARGLRAAARARMRRGGPVDPARGPDRARR